jgi:hypothetical protein
MTKTAAWTVDKGWHDVTEPERAAMQSEIVRNLIAKAKGATK